MAKWFGKVGYDTKVEIEPGIWKSKITEVEYFGDITSGQLEIKDNKNILEFTINPNFTIYLNNIEDK